ncbi:MAG: hexitol phosphatase HxpB [Microthrixaceae bacterium]
MVRPSPSSAVIFDMDGVLIDSEPVWEAAEVEVFASVGVHLSEADTATTTGLRVDEVVEHWLARRPWDDSAPGASVKEVGEAIVDLMVAHAVSRPAEIAGAADVVQRLSGAGWRLAVCSSSPRRLIEASLQGLGLDDGFELVHSAEDEPAGKPHPGCYLSTAEKLGVDPGACVAVEDSVNGAIAAAAAGHVVVAVPTPSMRHDRRFDFCARVLDGHHQLDHPLIEQLLRE